MHVKVAAGMNQDGEREVKETSIHTSFIKEVRHLSCAVVVEDGLNALLDGRVFDLFVTLNNFFDFLHNFPEREFCEFTCQTQIFYF